MTTASGNTCVGGWLSDHLPMLLRLGTTLTGSPTAATDLVADALARDRRRLDALRLLDYPEDALQALVVGQFLSTYRRRSPIRRPGVTPRLDTLRTAQQRAAVVLRDGVGITPPEIAAVLERPLSQVLAELEAVPDSLGAEISALEALAPPDLTTASLEIARRRVTRRRAGLAALVGVVALIAAAAIAVPTLVLPRLPAESRAPGAWYFSAEIRPALGWQLVSRTVLRTVEITELDPPELPSGDPKECYVHIHTAGSYDPTGTDVVEQTTVHGRAATLATDRTGSPLLAWEYGNNAWAVVSCTSTELIESELRAIAGWVRFRRTQAQLPFALDAVPAGYAIGGLTEYVRAGQAELTLERKALQRGDVNIIVAGPLRDVSFVGGETMTVNGLRGRLVGGTDPRLCLDRAEDVLCLDTFWPGGEWPEPAPQPVGADAILLGLASRLTLAADLSDSATWFDVDVDSGLPR